MLRRTTLALLAALALPAGAQAADPPPGAAISDNLEYVHLVPGTRTVVDVAFDTVGDTKLMLVTGRFGLQAYDMADPDRPRRLDDFLPADLAPGGAWQNEDMELDTRRKLAILSLDPRHTDADTGATGCPAGGSVRLPSCRSGFYVISYADPWSLEQVGDFVDLPAGHTSSCIQGCDYVWTGGPARRSDQGYLGPFTSGGAGDGRPIWVTDLRDPANPTVLPDPIDIGRNDGITDYSHDVQTDAEGIVWTSGRGGVRGYAVDGVHVDPYTGRAREATPANPVLVAGGGVADTADPAMFLHNSLRPTTSDVRADGVKKGDVLIGTEEQFSAGCDRDGYVTFSDLTDSWGGTAAATSTTDAPYRMRSLATWHPIKDGAEGAGGTSNCSAHYFALQDSVLATSWYGEGTRLLDVSDARDPRQIAFYRVTGTGSDNPSTTAYGAEWYEDRLLVVDIARGIEILKLEGGTKKATRQPTVRAPKAGSSRFELQPVRSSSAEQLVCPLFE